ncbi:MAG: carnitine dehydratase [Deltaproteobacteria bacterium]|nr:carnitine dehydratase [Deltaproteobacteria bacterium]
MTGPPQGPVPPEGAPGPLSGLRVIELASEWTAYAGKLLADLGAEVMLVEPPEGAPMRSYGPFYGDRPDGESSLWWWHYQTSKVGVTLDLDDEQDASLFRRLVEDADLVLEGESPGRLAAIELDHSDCRQLDSRLIWVSVTPFGRDNPRSSEPTTDLTLLAGAGPVWSCGYDDHSLPPVRGGGNQAIHSGGLHAVTATLAAVLRQRATGRGQHVDVSVHAALNVTTEEATFRWLVAGQTVQRQTGRHASPQPTMPTMAPDALGRFVNTGAPPRSPAEFSAVLEWFDDLGLRDEFPETFLLELGVERGGIDLADLADDAEVQAIYGAGREALIRIASRLDGYDYFVDGQRRGLATSVIYAPEELLSDPHFVARDFPTEVYDELLGKSVTHAGAPIAFGASPWRISRRAPRLGEHNAQILDALRGDDSESGHD